MVYKVIFSLSALTGLLFAQEPNIPDPLKYPSTKSFLDYFNPISGSLSFTECDLVVHAVEPLYLKRLYSSGNTPDSPGGWQIYPECKMQIDIYEKDKIEKEHRVTTYEPDGTRIEYSLRNKRYNKVKFLQFFKPIFDEKTLGASNIGETISGQTNLANIDLFIHRKEEHAELVHPDGSRRYYFQQRRDPPKKFFDLSRTSFHKNKGYKYLLREIKKPNGNYICYQYDIHGRVTRITSMNHNKTIEYAWIKFDYMNKYKKYKERCDLTAKVTTSDGQTLNLFYNKHTEKNFHTSEEIKEYKEKKEYSYYFLKGIEGNNINKGFKYKKGKDRIRFVDYETNYGKKKFQTFFYTKHDSTGKLTPSGEKEPLKDRLGSLKLPQSDGSFKVIYEIKYQLGQQRKNGSFTSGGITRVADSEYNSTYYSFNEYSRLQLIQYFVKDDFLFEEKLYWYDDPSHFIKAKITTDPKVGAISGIAYDYDQFGNIIEEVFAGNLTGNTEDPIEHDSGILSENNERCITKRKYSADGKNLLTHETFPNGKIVSYQYLPNTNLIEKKFTSNNTKKLIREFFHYNKDLVLNRTVVDDGSADEENDLTDVTERQITEFELSKEARSINLPEWIHEKALENGKEITRKSTKLYYTGRNQVQKVEIYDAEGKLYSEEVFSYDERGNLKKKTTPLGTGNYKYENQLLVESQEPGSPIKKELKYDAVDRLSSIIFSTPDTKKRTESYTYNTLGHCITYTNYQGHTKTYEKDRFDNIVLCEDIPHAAEDSGIPVTVYGYDISGNLAYTRDREGQQKWIKNTAFQKPYLISDEKGSEIRKIYTKDGLLEKEILQDLSEIHHEHDLFGREVSKKIFSPKKELLSSEEWEYDSFHLFSYTNHQGIRIEYAYDAFGRKKEEKTIANGEEKKKTFSYDFKDRLVKTSTHVSGKTLASCTKYNTADQIIEQWKEDSEGKKYEHTLYEYDAYGNREKRIQKMEDGEIIDIVRYDAYKRVIKHIDPKNRVTNFYYNDFALNDSEEYVTEKTIVDPTGNIIVETSDPAGNVASIVKKNPLEQILSKETFFYDDYGKKTLQKSFIYFGEELLKEKQTKWIYEDGKIKKVIENYEGDKERITSYGYDLKGRLRSKKNPNHITLTYDYDAFDRIIFVKSSDQTIHYEYLYDQKGYLEEVRDHVNNTTTKKGYDSWGRVKSETLENGITIERDYDLQDRMIKLHLPNGSVCYNYNDYFLESIERFDQDQNLKYVHQYTSYDSFGHNEEQELIGDLGKVSIRRDLLDRIRLISSPYEELSLDYESDNLSSATSTILGVSQFTYDDLSQLTSEQGHISHTFKHDSHHNCRIRDGESYEFDDFNQRTDVYTYDLNGNPFSKNSTEYEYDALNRLISITQGTRVTFYTYDGFDRRTRKEIYEEGVLISSQSFLYYDDFEIGVIEDDRVTELRILGLSIDSEVGGAVAVELDEKVYAPLHDQRGNVVHLIDVETKEVTESYYYSSFGEEKIFDESQNEISHSINPWRFSSKRYDEESGFLYFGKRFYDPESGRWLTPDPVGFIDSPNLFAYALNNPQTRIDAQGLIWGTVIQTALKVLIAAAGVYLEKRFNVILPANVYRAGISYDFFPDPITRGTILLPRFEVSITNPILGHIYTGFNVSRIGNGILNIDPKSQIGTAGDSEEHSDNLLITFINGIYNSYTDSHESAALCSNALGGYSVNFVYNASLGLLGDILEAASGLLFHSVTDPAALLIQEWTSHYIKTNGEGNIIHVCHSQGAIHTRNALEILNKTHPEITERIHVIAAGPAAFIDAHLCGSIKHFVDKADPVTMLDFFGRMKNKDTTVIIDSGSKVAHAFIHYIEHFKPYYLEVLEGL